jgi:hypothetical protein
MDVNTWILLTYKVPPEPAKKRIALWRKIKSMGAVYLQAGVCLLPKTDDHVRRLKMIENEIAGMEGDAILMETNGLDRAQEEKLRRVRGRDRARIGRRQIYLCGTGGERRGFEEARKLA